jgi:hypothetical protein
MTIIHEPKRLAIVAPRNDNAALPEGRAARLTSRELRAS